MNYIKGRRSPFGVQAILFGLMAGLLPARAGDPCNTPGGDTQPPSIVCPPALVLECGTTVPPPNLAGVVATDNCGTPVVSHAGDLEGTTACPVVITRTFVAVDAAGNSASCTQTITVRDTQRPVQVEFPLDLLVSCPSQAPAAVAPAMVDACDETLQVQLQVITQLSSVNCGRTILRRWTVRDDCGNFTRATQRILARDFTPPGISCDPVPALAGNADGQAVLPALSFHASDNCGDAPVVTQNPPAGTLLGPGEHTVTLAATDSCGNTASCPATVVVNSPTAGILLLKSVYPGHDGGASCPGIETVWGTANTPVTYCFRVVNNGQANLSNVTISDPAFGISPIHVGALAAGQSLFRSIESVIASSLVNVATVTGTSPGGIPVTDSDPAEVVLTAPSIEIQATAKSSYANSPCPGFDPHYEINGETATYCLKVTNTGNVQLNDIAITDPAREFAPVLISSIAAGQSATSQVAVMVNGSHTNQIRVTARPPLGNAVTDEDSLVVLGFGPGGKFRQTVYAGHDGGLGCPGTTQLSISGPTAVTYCFAVETGESYQQTFAVELTDEVFGYSNYPLLSSPIRDVIWATTHVAETVLTGPITNHASVYFDAIYVDYPVASTTTVATVHPSLSVTCALFSGHGAPTLCQTATNRLSIALKEPLTHCFTVTNNGDTPVSDITVDAPGLGIDESIMVRIPGADPLLPGDSRVYAYPAVAQIGLTSQVLVGGTAVTASGETIGNLNRLEATGSAELTATPP